MMQRGHGPLELHHSSRRLMVHPPLEQARWFEERLRYQTLRYIFDTAGPNCDQIITGPQIGVGLGLRSDEIFRVVDWLDRHGYLHGFGSRPDLCLTPKAIAFFEAASERRKSLRD